MENLACTPGRGWLHRLVRPLVIHAFDRFYCRLDRSRIKSQ